jgi:hypothetical protein
MSGEKSELTSRETRKQLLLMESHLNRVALCQDCGELSDQLREVGSQVHAATSIASTFFHTFTPSPKSEEPAEPGPRKPSWISTIVRGVKLGSSLWLAFKSRS